jgi:hypothetical protein
MNFKAHFIPTEPVQEDAALLKLDYHLESPLMKSPDF